MHPFAVFLACFYFGIRHLFSLIFLYTSSVLNICFRFRLYIFCFASSEVKFGGHPTYSAQATLVVAIVSRVRVSYLSEKKFCRGQKTEQDCFNCT